MEIGDSGYVAIRIQQLVPYPIILDLTVRRDSLMAQEKNIFQRFWDYITGNRSPNGKRVEPVDDDQNFDDLNGTSKLAYIKQEIRTIKRGLDFLEARYRKLGQTGNITDIEKIREWINKYDRIARQSRPEDDKSLKNLLKVLKFIRKIIDNYRKLL